MTADERSATPHRAVPRDRTAPDREPDVQLLRAILTDTHFWVPTIVLALGILLLVALH